MLDHATIKQYNRLMLRGIAFFNVFLTGLFFAVPTSTNYTLKSYDFGNGGGSTSSTNYKLNVSVGAQSGNGTQNSTSYKANGGVLPTQHANVPLAPSFSNPSSEYNRLKLVLNTGSNPADTKYQVAISSDGFTTTNYVQTDNTVGPTNSISTYQTYATWGGASGVWVIGLLPSTTYSVKVRALQGGFTGSAYSPTASAATVQSSLTFTVGTSLTATPPYVIAVSGLSAGSVVSGNATANVGLSTNAVSGGAVYINSTNAGLSSASASASIASATADLTVATKGYGVKVTSTSQASGGPLAGSSPFNGSGNNVGGLTTNLQQILVTSSPVTTGTATVTVMAKADNITPSASDYTDTIRLVAAMLF